MRKYKFHRVDPEKKIDVWEEVEPVLWQWEAVYSDGVTLKQYDDDGIFHQFKEIEQNRLHLFVMKNAKTGQKFTLFFPQKAKLIHFYRNAICNVGTSFEERIRIFCFGFETKKTKQLFVILPNDELVIVDDLEKVVFF